MSFKSPFRKSLKLSILDRYLMEQFTGPFLLAIGGFTIIAIVEILFYLVDLAVTAKVPVSVVTRLLLFKLPGIMVIYFPMAVLFSVMLLLVRMAKDSELTVLQSSGIHTLRILAPLFLMLLLATGFSYLTNEKIVPWTNEVSDQIILEEIQKKPPPSIVENIVFKDPTDRFFYIKQINPQTLEMDYVLIFEKDGNYPRIVTAERAYWNERSWTLSNGKIQKFGSEGDLEFVDEFAEMKIHVDRSSKQYFSQQKKAHEMDSKELKDKIDVLNKGGISTRALEVEYHMKKSIPAACLIFGLMGIAYCLSFVRSGKDWWGVILAIIIAVLSVGLYFFIMAVFRSLGKNGELSPMLGAWIPNIIYGTIGTILIGRASVK